MAYPSRIRSFIVSVLAVAATGLLAPRDAGAELADIASVPLANSPSDAVLPNLMYILDDSDSMKWSYMPDQIYRDSSLTLYYNCKKCTTSSCTGPGATSSASGFPCGNASNNANTFSSLTDRSNPTYAEAPYYANGFNKIWYNPDITYAPGVDSAGTSLGNADPTNALDDFYLGNTKTNLVGGFPEVVYCNVATPSAVDLADPAKCRKNGIHNVAPFAGTSSSFLYWPSTGANSGFPTTAYYNKQKITSSNAHYYTISPVEHCEDENLTTCVLSKTPTGTNTNAAPIRWCKSAADAILATVVSGNSAGTARCQKKFTSATYKYPRYGAFTRTDIVPATASYAKSATSVRTDCASATSCTYAEEIQNFANWWTYYRTRLALMKTATGRAFLGIDDRFRIGFITIHPGSMGAASATEYRGVAKFDSTVRAAWYQILYDQNTAGGTANRVTLDMVGRYYKGEKIKTGDPDPMEYSCQQNFALLTTDGYWNDSYSGVANQDNADSGLTTRAYGAYDGGVTGATNTLADVAAYYYKTDLRTGAGWENNVPTTDRDTVAAQHMVTFTLGLGLEGLMDYRPDYESATTGDFHRIRTGVNNACSWTTGTCNWPLPASNQPSALDDLWHAAVNGRGKYFSAGDPNSLSQGLQEALASLNIQTAAAAASATSSPNITETDNFIYSSTFRTAKWDGEVVAQRIDTVSGNVLPDIVWSAQSLLDGRSGAGTDSRDIFTIDESAGGKRKPFTWASLSDTPVGGIARERDYFEAKCTKFSQCALLTLAQKAIANNGDNLVNWLRGHRQFESFVIPETNPPFRAREHILGDTVNATPAFMKAPQFSFADVVSPTYETFKTTNTARQATLFIAANDGMLHALNGDTGTEMWAYVPRIVMPKLHRLATQNWATTHEYSVDGSPQLMDAFVGGGWKTVLVSGLNGGGRGYYALDVTVPTSPKVLWEICSDPTICAISDPDIGLTHGNPVITKRASDKKWVVLFTSGMNNVSPGTGRGYLFVADLATGAILQKIDTGVGTLTTPAGFNHLSAYADNFAINNTAKYVYGGDLYGNVWKFDLQGASPVAIRLAALKDAGGKPQSITSRPELGLINGFRVVFVGTGRYLGLDDLVDPASLAPPNQWAYDQSLYAIKDDGPTFANFRAANVVENVIVPVGDTSRTTTNNAVDWATQDGWFIDFNPGGASPGERVNIDPQLIQGTLLVVTNVPNNNACTVGGDSWIYQFDYRSGTFVQSAAGGQAGKKYTGKITVGVVVVRLPSGVFKGIATGATGTKSTFEVNIGGGGGSARRISWRELMQR
jgi:type IV pilus assembly protein PilY1